jgi:hypothetical protein
MPSELHIDIVIDGPPGPEGSRLIEIESAEGHSIGIGTWSQRTDGHWVLRITATDIAASRPPGPRH